MSARLGDDGRGAQRTWPRRCRKEAIALALCGTGLFLLAAALALVIYLQLPGAGPSGAGMVAVMMAWAAYLAMTACNAIAAVMFLVSKRAVPSPMSKLEKVLAITAAVCQVAPMFHG